MKIILADKSGFCFGVKRAVEEAVNTRKKFQKNIYTLGPLIHNNNVVKRLENKGIFSIEEKDIDNLKEGDVVIIRSHGVPEYIYTLLENKKINVVDATCPYVSNIQKKVQKYYKLGYSILIVGDEAHPEVIGINGWCNNAAIISKDGLNLRKLPPKLCIVSQTTEKQSNWQKVLSAVIEQCKEFIAFNTICSATEVRQKSADDISKKVDVMIVLGGKNSSNTTKLYEICRKNCKSTIHVENSGEIPDNIIRSNKIKTIGVTAGASTPDWIIKEAILKMSDDKNLALNEQLSYMDKNDTQIILGEKIKGTVISVNPNEVFLNIGYKSDGILPKSEITRNEEDDLEQLIHEGDELEVKVIRRQNEDGYVVLSKLELERENAYRELRENNGKSTVLQVTVKEAVNGGLVANYKGARVFIPASHVELYHVDDLSQYINKELDVNIIEFKEEKRGTRIVASRREILRTEREKMEEKTWNILQKDTVVEGEVRRLTDFGAFVDVQGVDGLLHVSELSWGRVGKPSDVLKIGDKIKVYILDVDKEKKKLSLSIKKLMEDPWNNVDIKYPVGSVVLGKVVRFANFGAFVELEPGVDALVHISQISHKRIDKPDDVLEIGQEIKAKILEVNKDNQKIALSIKEVDEI
ncbi:bifunctional 4-hydroxy-3-methylbut-2-enyl diphosphate reductase/30S ribosomal protein S1 [Clostridium luticellarii]|jgi:4-hydroxy-3-methylbut-2-enyl diphosphate reductase|uniref:4-hydroxy-3-methylbut-2-enyl diphosphate reductase n=1 Tax=Clostridium luticellarii TaxID=1691940 RepID=A0A2T0B3A0_9CLOT|nr:bifunctional 4-hydroxy-3-methylbut-2-enyl diphosphate reductase/30S ribosomal protein S1 [Clostridium luticellarii]MCI1944169.1 bifunctional 4-hydroxy-3-methylbut-2-enyl diphosphate reductase/30S ribosomal protein S1 [Clostridium luticellarii]MCI1967671.1 bifunctional 4-hydroxy-3-methylbut-2-enyl diphosphate reductase/30S ribosomal protein S1 [Clostridium luticellarii]MCI1994880.1 bifunctional 4-hydroxy-3-methylbut-2-enyl diphosphate reductase/30S ribosomal protein S1 [Clostridium luticellari